MPAIVRPSLLAAAAIILALPSHAASGVASGDRAWGTRAEAPNGRLAWPEQVELAIRSSRQSERRT